MAKKRSRKKTTGAAKKPQKAKPTTRGKVRKASKKARAVQKASSAKSGGTRTAAKKTARPPRKRLMPIFRVTVDEVLPGALARLMVAQALPIAPGNARVDDLDLWGDETPVLIDAPAPSDQLHPSQPKRQAKGPFARIDIEEVLNRALRGALSSVRPGHRGILRESIESLLRKSGALAEGQVYLMGTFGYPRSPSQHTTHFQVRDGTQVRVERIDELDVVRSQSKTLYDEALTGRAPAPVDSEQPHA